MVLPTPPFWLATARIRGSGRTGRRLGASSSVVARATRPPAGTSSTRPPSASPRGHRAAGWRGSSAARPRSLPSLRARSGAWSRCSTWNHAETFHVKPRSRPRTAGAGAGAGEALRASLDQRERSAGAGAARRPGAAPARPAPPPATGPDPPSGGSLTSSCPPSRSRGAATLGDHRGRSEGPGHDGVEGTAVRGVAAEHLRRPADHLDTVGQTQPADGAAQDVGAALAGVEQHHLEGGVIDGEHEAGQPGTAARGRRSAGPVAAPARTAGRARSRRRCRRPGSPGAPAPRAAARSSAVRSGIRRQDHHASEGVLALRAGGHAGQACSPCRGRPCDRRPTSARAPGARPS